MIAHGIPGANGLAAVLRVDQENILEQEIIQLQLYMEALNVKVVKMSTKIAQIIPIVQVFEI